MNKFIEAAKKLAATRKVIKRKSFLRRLKLEEQKAAFTRTIK